MTRKEAYYECIKIEAFAVSEHQAEAMKMAQIGLRVWDRLVDVSDKHDFINTLIETAIAEVEE